MNQNMNQMNQMNQMNPQMNQMGGQQQRQMGGQMNPQMNQMGGQMGGQMNPQMMDPPGGPNAQNRQFVNQNPMLGGTKFNKPGFAPLLPFYGALNATPDHNMNMGKFFIPWDVKDCDYVYGVFPDKVFRGKFSRMKLKQVILFLFNDF